MWRRSWRSFGAGAWVFPCDPELPANKAQVIWDIAAQPAAVVLVNAPMGTDSSVHFETLPSAAIAKDCGQGRYELWSDDADFQQVFITREVAGTGPVAAIVLLDQHTAARLDAVRKVWRQLTTRSAGRPVLPITAQQRRRLILMLRALDGAGQRASYRDLAAILLDPDVRHQSRREWITSSYRAQIIRIVRDGLHRMEGGYRDLLAGTNSCAAPKASAVV